MTRLSGGTRSASSRRSAASTSAASDRGGARLARRRRRRCGSRSGRGADPRAAGPARTGCPATAEWRPAPMRSSRATGEPCIGPAPPNGTSVHRRGSCPRSTETTRMPRTMLACATRRMPAAAATRSMPSGVGDMVLRSPCARPRHRAAELPPSRVSASSRPSTRLASEIVGRVPPRP